MSNHPILRSQTIHQSLSQVHNSNNHPLPTHTQIGCLVTVGHHHGLDRLMADVLYQTPYINTLCQGEIVELSEADTYTRQRLLDIATACRSAAEELTNHADRLEEIAVSDDILTEVDIESLASQASKPSTSRSSSSAVTVNRPDIDAADTDTDDDLLDLMSDEDEDDD